jgi:hypothetical protein
LHQFGICQDHSDPVVQIVEPFAYLRFVHRLANLARGLLRQVRCTQLTLRNFGQEQGVNLKSRYLQATRVRVFTRMLTGHFSLLVASLASVLSLKALEPIRIIRPAFGREAQDGRIEGTNSCSG